MAQGCLYYTANEVMEILGVSRAKAYKVVRELNEELAAKGYIVTAGKEAQEGIGRGGFGGGGEFYGNPGGGGVWGCWFFGGRGELVGLKK